MTRMRLRSARSSSGNVISSWRLPSSRASASSRLTPPAPQNVASISWAISRRKRLEGRRAKALKELEKLDKKLGNQNFLDKAAPEAVEKVRTEHAELTQELKLIKAQLEE